MGFEITRDDDRINLAIICDNYDCLSEIACSPAAVLFVSIGDADFAGGSLFHVACGPRCAERVADLEGFGDDWQRLPFAPAMAELVARAGFLPRQIDPAAYVSAVSKAVEATRPRRVA